ncbi:MAG: RNA-binding S4 domain-containing protein [Gammaproteobacteria bacterium]|nr:RNA-binding S4 domain-containing protein [Gammaproteobacteria bacterium]MDH3536022.1 RNA-binding S4 domain-containing protein [Gammaproteobacteria bacterium]
MSESENIIAELESEFVELYKILKFEGLADSGGNAKQAIEDGLVSVNGEVETRKRKKIRAGDQIDFIDHHIDVIGKTVD